MKLSSLQFFSRLKWLDNSPLLPHIEPYRRALFTQALDGTTFNLVLAGRGKKNAKTLDLCLAGLYSLTCRESPQGSQCYILANDKEQAADDLDLCKKLVRVNPVLAKHLLITRDAIERKDGRGVLDILPAGDIAGSHGKTYVFCGFDEIHAYRSWDILEALQGDPTRRESLMWITTYASLFNRPGVPLFDLCQQGRQGADPRLLFSWYAADYTTDPAFTQVEPEARANPSMASWTDTTYLEQQRRRLPSHKFRRLHLNLPGAPEGSAFQPDPVLDAVARGTRVRPWQQGIIYSAFVDMSGGSSDDAVLAIAHTTPDGKAVLDTVVHQGSQAPFDPRQAVGRFAGVLREYHVSTVFGDRYAGETFRADFNGYGLAYEVSAATTHQLYAAFMPVLNAHEAVLLDSPQVESQLLGLVWRGGKIGHLGGEHDDWCNAAVGALLLAREDKTSAFPAESQEDREEQSARERSGENWMDEVHDPRRDDDSFARRVRFQ